MDLHQDPIGKEEVHMTRSASFAAAIFLLLLLGIGSTAWAYRDYFSETQKAQLTNIQTVLVEVIALTDTGAGNPEGIREVVTRRGKVPRRPVETMIYWMPLLAYGRDRRVR